MKRKETGLAVNVARLLTNTGDLFQGARWIREHRGLGTRISYRTEKWPTFSSLWRHGDNPKACIILMIVRKVESEKFKDVNRPGKWIFLFFMTTFSLLPFWDHLIKQVITIAAQPQWQARADIPKPNLKQNKTNLFFILPCFVLLHLFQTIYEEPIYPWIHQFWRIKSHIPRGGGPRTPPQYVMPWGPGTETTMKHTWNTHSLPKHPYYVLWKRTSP